MFGLTFNPKNVYLDSKSRLNREKQMDKKPFNGNLILVFGWYGASLSCLFFCLLFLFYISTSEIKLPKNSTYQLYQALPPTQTQTQDGIVYSDGRAKAVENFFKSYNSILGSHANLFIQTADKYHLDWKLLPSIAMQESNGGKRVINDSHNPFGFGIYGSSIVKFGSWEEGIEKVGKTLRENYLNQGLRTPEEIMAKYTPPSLAKGGTWAKGVRSFMEELR